MSLTLKLLLLLLLLFVLSHHVDSGSIVKFLPGFEGPLPFELETGYIGIGEEEDIQLFYYFIKSEKNPKEDPLLIWLNGGPGCSSLLGLLLENGPLAFKFEVYNGDLASLVSTTYSWTQVANIIFLDQPVGSGFSYSRTPLDKISDTNEVKMIHEFLQKWLNKHPQFFSNPFYVSGDSYSGKIVPALVQEISKGNYICCKPLINLQGYVLGNPVTYPELDINYRIPFSHGMSLISDELYESLNTNCKGIDGNVDPRNTKCLELVAEYHKCTDKINPYSILLPNCDDDENSENISPDCYAIRTLVDPQDVQLIESIPLSKSYLVDKEGWHLTQNWRYTVKSGYQVERIYPDKDNPPPPPPSLFDIQLTYLRHTVGKFYAHPRSSILYGN
ncbi:serine carboxypeptidase-like 12 isoform X4 [Raphanus sativus]|uniref:Serine carboxypeptidase-like 12 isoform X4 n=1 Tax=Raphanus sativus TaxID=3726 RepID=A0A6J0JSP2_RAPSA|nr:serine carboxypeptidase-like 12 isoform X4 [Raphanus sativus]